MVGAGQVVWLLMASSTFCASALEPYARASSWKNATPLVDAEPTSRNGGNCLLRLDCPQNVALVLSGSNVVSVKSGATSFAVSIFFWTSASVPPVEEDE